MLWHLGFVGRVLYSGKRLVTRLASPFLQQRHVAVFMFLRKNGGQPEFLQVHHADWGCYLFPGAQVNPDETTLEWIAERCAGKIGLTASTSVGFQQLVPHRMEKFDFVSIKRSGSDLERRAYFYRFYLVKLRNPKQWRTFERIVDDHPGTRWMAYNELLNDRITYAKNRDVIDHIAMRMSKGYGLPKSDAA